MWGPSGVVTAARVNIVTANNVTWEDAFQFDPPWGTGTWWEGQAPYWPWGTTGPNWSLTGFNFRMDIKGARGITAPMLSLDNGPTGSTLFVIIDPDNRIVSANVPEAVITGLTGSTGATGVGLIPGEYVYDFIMYDGSDPPLRIMLMQGRFFLQDGVTGG